MKMAMAALAATVFLGSAVATSDAALLTRFEFENNLDDTTGTLTATFGTNGGSNVPSYAAGVTGQSIALTAVTTSSTQYVEAPVAPGTITDAFTLSMWLDPTTQGGNLRALASVKSGTNNGFTLFMNQFSSTGVGGTGRLLFEVKNGAATPAYQVASETGVVMAGDGVGDDEWVHIAVRVNRSTGTVEFFKNGVQTGYRSDALSGPLTVTDWTLDGSMRLGNVAQGAANLTYGYDGAMDEFRIYNGVLTNDEIADLAVVPEPGSAGLALAGIAALGLRRRRRQ